MMVLPLATCEGIAVVTVFAVDCNAVAAVVAVVVVVDLEVVAVVVDREDWWRLWVHRDGVHEVLYLLVLGIMIFVIDMASGFNTL